MRQTRQPLTVVTHPLVATKLSQLRKPQDQCRQPEFTRLMRELGMYMAYEVARDLPTHPDTIDLERGGTADVTVLSIDRLVLVPVLRSGITMADGFREALPAALVGHIGIHVNKSEKKATPREYIVSLPEIDSSDKTYIVIDPVSATGGTACLALSTVNSVGPAQIIFVCLVISKKGVDRIFSEHPTVPIYCAAVDAVFQKGRVLPGIGSVSERIFGFRTVTVENP